LEEKAKQRPELSDGHENPNKVASVPERKEALSCSISSLCTTDEEAFLCNTVVFVETTAIEYGRSYIQRQELSPVIKRIEERKRMLPHGRLVYEPDYEFERRNPKPYRPGQYTPVSITFQNVSGNVTNQWRVISTRAHSMEAYMVFDLVGISAEGNSVSVIYKEDKKLKCWILHSVAIDVLTLLGIRDRAAVV